MRKDATASNKVFPGERGKCPQITAAVVGAKYRESLVFVTASEEAIIRPVWMAVRTREKHVATIWRWALECIIFEQYIGEFTHDFGWAAPSYPGSHAIRRLVALCAAHQIGAAGIRPPWMTTLRHTLARRQVDARSIRQATRFNPTAAFIARIKLLRHVLDDRHKLGIELAHNLAIRADRQTQPVPAEDDVFGHEVSRDDVDAICGRSRANNRTPRTQRGRLLLARAQARDQPSTAGVMMRGH